MTEDPEKRVVPFDRARGDLQDAVREAVVRRFHWQKPAIVLGFFALTALAYWAIQERREDQLRQSVLQAQAAVHNRYGTVLEKLGAKVARLVAAEAGPYRGDFHDPVFRVKNLPDGKGIYVRVPIDAGRGRASLEKAARRQSLDAVAGCLGVPTRILGQILLDGTIAVPQFRRKIERAGSEERLNALDQDMVVRIKRDIPNLAAHLGPDYLIAVLDEPGGRKPPRRAMIWDLHTDRLLVRVRNATADDVIPVRWTGKGAIRSKGPPPRVARNTAADCSIAAAIRARTGETNTEITAPAAP